MASKLQLARGSLKGKQNSNLPLLPSEMFWVARTSDENNANSEFTKWDEGTLYVGRPSVNLDRPSEKPIPIAGARTYFSVVNRGYLSTETSIQDSIFQHALVGDLYIWTQDATAGVFHNVDDFRKDDLLLILDNGGDDNINSSGIIIDQSLIKYKRINASGGYADDVYFTQNGKEDGDHWTGFDATNVQDALLELNYEKGQYCGTIGTNAQIPAVPVIGGIYLVTADQLSFNSDKDDAFSPDKGDFVYWKQTTNIDITTGTWVQIPSGYTNANEIDYYDHDDDIDVFVNDLFTTFNSDHVEKFKSASKNVHTMLDFLMAQKAQLDEQGKIPLSQLHDTVLGSLQFRGTWNPLIPDISVEDMLNTVDGKQSVKDEYAGTIVNTLPGFKGYQDGDSGTVDILYEGVNHGDYYVVDTQSDILNLQYDYYGVNFELNKGDWIVYCDSDAIDTSSYGTTGKHGFWTKIDNTDRLSAIQYKIDVQNKNNFFVTHEIDESILTLVGTPKIVAQNKIGLEFLGNNTVAITGRGLIDQLEYEDPLPNFLVQYDNSTGTVKNSYVEQIDGDYSGQERLDHHDDTVTNAVTRFHSNVEIGNADEMRTTKTYGDVFLFPHAVEELDQVNYHKSVMKIGVDALDGDGILRRRWVSLVAPNGETKYGVDEDVADSITNVILPEHTSTLIGKLAGVEFETRRVLKSTTEGYAESTSIEEHINDDTNNSNFHDSINNIVEFHSQVSAPINNSYEYYFGDWNTSEDQGYYSNNDFDENGNLARLWGKKISARLVKNTYQVDSNITVMLPTESGTLITEELVKKIFDNADDDTWLTMFGQSIDLTTTKRVNTLQKSPFRLINNALRTRLLNSKIEKVQDETKAELQTATSKAFADEIAKEVDDGSFKSSLDKDIATTVSEADIIAAKFDKDGNILEKKSIAATDSLVVSDPDYGTVLFQGARRNFPDAEQYYDPATGEATTPVDVVVDAPNESGVLITSNSVISGGVWN